VTESSPISALALDRRRIWLRPMVRWRGAGDLAIVALGLVTIVALLAGVLAPHSTTAPAGAPFAPPGSHTLLGTDEVGRDILSRVLIGLRATWFAALAVIASGVAIGGVIGLVAGASGGWVDTVLMRATDAFLALPAPVLAIAVAAALGPSFAHSLLAVGIVWWPFYARIVRAEVRASVVRPHFEAAKLTGIGRRRLWTRHLLPAAIPAVVVTASLDVGGVALTLSGLSFLGLGAPQPAPELGSMCAQGLPYLLNAWWVPTMPAVAVFVLAFVANLAGDRIRTRIEGR
jgi:peptide/nickel transport system permease protein